MAMLAARALQRARPAAHAARGLPTTVRRWKSTARSAAPAHLQMPCHIFFSRLIAWSRRFFRCGGSLMDDEMDADVRFTGMSGGKLVHEALVECGVDVVFGYSGGANLPILDQFAGDSPIRFINNRSEQCCGHAAEGYARATGRVGVVLTTSGPGLTNIITPLQDARGDSTPILALSGQVPTAAVGTDAFQECLAVDLTRPCTKWSYQVRSVEEVRSVVHEAYRVASTGKRGPVHLDLPKDVMTALLRGGSLPLPMQPPPLPVDRTALEKVIKLLSTAKKPILYVGQGANEAREGHRSRSSSMPLPQNSSVTGGEKAKTFDLLSGNSSVNRRQGRQTFSSLLALPSTNEAREENLSRTPLTLLSENSSVSRRQRR